MLGVLCVLGEKYFYKNKVSEIRGVSFLKKKKNYFRSGGYEKNIERLAFFF
jgi:hypothetical protein